jgi:type I restriction enzyme S subunit
MQNTSISIRNIKTGSNIIKPNFHLNYGKKRIVNLLQNGYPCDPLGSLVGKIYTGGIFKRIFVENPQYGVKYVTAQYMTHANPLEVSKLVSKKFTPRQKDMTLEENQILVSCAGTVGNVRLIDEFLAGVIGSQDIIRVVPDNAKAHFGYIYAYLASKTAYDYIQSYIYGSVVPRIEPNTLSLLPVPVFSDKLKDEANLLIEESVKLRVDANNLLEEAISNIEENIPDFIIPKIDTCSISTLMVEYKRFDSTFSAKELARFYNTISGKGFKLFKVKDISKRVFTPNIFKRNKVDNNKYGVPYLGGAELLNSRPVFKTFLSKKSKNLDDYKLKKGWIAIQDSGSISSMGYISLIPEYLNDVAATNKLIRIIPNSDLKMNYYLFAMLKSKSYNDIIKSLSYGTGQLHIDNKQISNLKIPILDNVFDRITENVGQYLWNLEEAYNKEYRAINLIETQIDSWQN